MAATSGAIRCWESHELVFETERAYENPYVDVELWVILTGPDDIARRVTGFWDGGSRFCVRVVAISPGRWSWVSHASSDDPGLAGRSGEFDATDWTEEEKRANPNRRGFIRATESGRAWQYADGTPFYMLADTWWSAMTWRYPSAKEPVPADYAPSLEEFSFEAGTQWLRACGFNSIGTIASLPNWADDGGPKLHDDDGIILRSGKCPRDNVCMTMHSENGHRAFMFPGRSNGRRESCPDYDRINPAYFQDMDRKMFHMSDTGMVPYLETARRDVGLAWERYHEWPHSFARYINYLAARYGSLNMIFSLLHFDTKGATISPERWNDAFDFWYEHYTLSAGLPFGQPSVLMGAQSTYRLFGHVTDHPWLQAHSVGNPPKAHSMEEALEEAMRVTPPIPGYCNEPYYVGWYEDPRGGPVETSGPNAVAGELVEMNSDRDNYFARAHAYGHMMSGGLAGHIVGTGSRWCIGPGEPYTPHYPPPGQTLRYTFVAEQARFLPAFLMSAGLDYRELMPANDHLPHRKRDGFGSNLLEGWAHVVRTDDARLALCYFERQSQNQSVVNMRSNTRYRLTWFNPRTGDWTAATGGEIATDDAGTLELPPFPEGGRLAVNDWAARLELADEA